MSELKITIEIELPAEIRQQEIWDLETQLADIEMVEVDLYEPKDAVTASLLVLNIATTVAGTIATLAGGTQPVYQVGKILYDFLHKSDKTPPEQELKKRVIIIKGKKRIELYNLSIEEIERILKDV